MRDWHKRGHILIGAESWDNNINLIDKAQKISYGALTFTVSDRKLHQLF